MDQDHAMKLVGAYRRILNTADGGIIMDDLREFSMIDQQAGSELTHAECAYRNALQDFFRYIDAMVAD